MGCALEMAMAVLVALAVYWLWPRLHLPRLGREEIWFSMGWFLTLGLGAGWRALWPQPTSDQAHQLLRAGTCSTGALLLGGLFVVLLLAGRSLGNYKLWLGITYLCGITLSLASLTLRLRSEISMRPERDLVAALAAAAISFMACLLLLPWVRPDLAFQWPPPPGALVQPLLAALLWGGISGASLLLVRLMAGRRRAAWIVYLAVGLGPGPALAVTWFKIAPLGLAFLILAGLAALRLVSRRPGQLQAAVDTEGQPQPVPFYWLLRTLMLIWWGMGAAVTLCLAWWYPRVGELFLNVSWLRAVGLGAFLVGAVGLLAEYSLPLLGKELPVQSGPDRKVAGVFASCLAFLAALGPFLLMAKPANPALPIFFAERARAVLVGEEVTLGPHKPELELRPPTWLTGLSRVFVVSQMDQGAWVEQGQAVLQLVATDEQDLPHIYQLRAGVDTADWALNQQEAASRARHREANPASTWLVYTPKGEAFRAHDYYTGLYLGKRVERLTSVKLKYIFNNQIGRPPVLVKVKTIFLN